MDMNKNINLGNISAGRTVHIGDNYNTTNFIDGLSFLLVEYQQQLDDINNFILSFKPKTALDLLNNLEDRIIKGQAQIDDKTKSKILYLRALCKSDLEEYAKENSAKDFIKAYLLNKNDEFLKERAAIEYLNLDEEEKAIQLAEEIIQTNEYNFSAWFIKVLTSKSFEESYNTVPKDLKNNEDFRLSIVYQLVRLGQIQSYENLKEAELNYDIDFLRYNKLTFFNKGAWFMAVDLAINKLFWLNPVNYIAGDIFPVNDFEEINQITSLIEKIVQTLENTELSDSLNHSKFFLYYFRYILYNKKEDAEKIQNIYALLEKPSWYYTRILCQVLNYQQQYQNSNDVLNEYQESHGELISEYFLFKATVLQLLEQYNEVYEIYEEYLNSIPILNEKNVINITNIFFNIFYNQGNIEVIEKALSRILSKEFVTPEYRLFLDTVVKIMCGLDYNIEDVIKNIGTLKQYKHFDENYKLIIVTCIHKTGKLIEALSFLETFVNKSKISTSLRSYILLLNEVLYDRNLNAQGKYKELLELLKFWRLNNPYPDEFLLGFEHNLYLEIKDFETLVIIDRILYNEFSNNENYLLFLLYSLEKNKCFEEIRNLSEMIKIEFESEEVGLSISQILLQNKINTEKGFKILYHLALNSVNSKARKSYFEYALTLPNYLKEYEKVEIGTWVYYKINDEIFIRNILDEKGLNKELINRSVGDVYMIKSGFLNKDNSIEIIQICNNELKLYKDILEEVKNPLNELSIQSFRIPENSQDIQQFLVENFGTQGTNESIRKKEILNEYFRYKKGFSEIVKALFKDNTIDAYLILTQVEDNKFTTIPSVVTPNISVNDDLEFTLDSSSLLLFYYLEKELDFQFKHKFKISKLLLLSLEKDITEVENEPYSPMSINITEKGIERYKNSNDFKENRIQFLKSVVDWINKECVLDNVEEKLDLLLKFQKEEKEIDDSLRVIYDHMFLSHRLNNRLISSDITLFLFNKERNIINNILNPQKYIEYFYPEKSNKDFYRFLLKSNYIGIDINLETLKNEFYDFLAEKENYYNQVLENLKFAININPTIITTCIGFLKDLYLNISLNLEKKNSFAFDIFNNSIYGMPKDLVDYYEKKLATEFELLGEYYNEVHEVFNNVKSRYRFINI